MWAMTKPEKEGAVTVDASKIMESALGIPKVSVIPPKGAKFVKMVFDNRPGEFLEVRVNFIF